MTFAQIIRDYNLNYREDESLFFGSLQNFEEVLLYAGLAHNMRGQRLAHMNRLRYDALARGLREMTLNRSRLQMQTDFDSLLTTITSILSSIEGLGPVYCYDSAYRIGAYLKIYPEHIYLHAGTTRGAITLRIPTSGKQFIDISDLPRDLSTIDSTLEPRHYEDILCIYANDFEQ